MKECPEAKRNEKEQSPARRVSMFKPDKTVTRKEQALYLQRLLGMLPHSGGGEVPQDYSPLLLALLPLIKRGSQDAFR